MIYLYCTTCQTTHPLTADTCPCCGSPLDHAPLIRTRPPSFPHVPSGNPRPLTIFRLIRLIAHFIR